MCLLSLRLHLSVTIESLDNVLLMQKKPEVMLMTGTSLINIAKTSGTGVSVEFK